MSELTYHQLLKVRTLSVLKPHRFFDILIFKHGILLCEISQIKNALISSLKIKVSNINQRLNTHIYYYKFITGSIFESS